MAKRIQLTPRHRKMVQAALVRVFLRRFGKKLVIMPQAGPFRVLEWETPDLLLAEQEKLATRLDFGGETLRTSCNCDVGSDCRHAAAIVLYLLDIKNAEIVYAKSAGDAEAGERPIYDFVRGRSQEKFSAGAEEFLRVADQWFGAKVSRISSGELCRLCGRAVYRGYNDHDVLLYPGDGVPRDAGEFLAALSIVAGRLGMTIPGEIARVIDDNAVLELRRRWQEEENVGEWRRALGGWGDDSAPGQFSELRLRLHEGGAVLECRPDAAAEFVKASRSQIEPLIRRRRHRGGDRLSLGMELVLRAACDLYGNFDGVVIAANEPALIEALSCLLDAGELFFRHVVGVDGGPLTVVEEPLRWRLTEPGADGGAFYRLELLDASGGVVSPPVVVLPGRPVRYITPRRVYTVEHWARGLRQGTMPMYIPVRALETRQGLSALRLLNLPLPPKIASRVRLVRPSVIVEAEVSSRAPKSADYLRLSARAVYSSGSVGDMQWTGRDWRGGAWEEGEELIQVDNDVLDAAAAWLKMLPLRLALTSGNKIVLEQRIAAKAWPGQFAEWLGRRPEGCEIRLSGELASMADGRVEGTVRLDIGESAQGIDWFDLNVALQVTDTTLTQDEIHLLLKAQGQWVRIAGKGWRRLDLQISEEQRAELALLGLAAHDFSGEKQRLHALQLGALTKGAGFLLDAHRVKQVRRRIEEIKMRVMPPVPGDITAEMRPYQIEGFHFLSYLTENSFGGVLADDMGLGKTLQTLAWIAWLRRQKPLAAPVLVVCPKSVQDNWRAEAARFFPGLAVDVWTRDTAGKFGADGSVDLLVIHYTQLRRYSEMLTSRQWGAVVLDEAQAIKNPSSQSARAACALTSPHRLALTGTPIENRLMDLWSIFSFAMPGVFGNRASFARNFDQNGDPLARRRLAARTRPFLLRRTKKEVERDLPDRIEEDLVMEFDGTQAALYQAELKRARAHLLNVSTSSQLDKVRFHILTSLLRLRQICCHPQLVGFGKKARGKRFGSKDADAEDEGSAKLFALLETIEPLMEEGHKVLVFSQFVQMLDLIEDELAVRKWPVFKLTGDTEDRGPLVGAFQKHEGEAVFLISLKAGGTGLNLTAASYVVLFDPWWNPAVEAQAIDRTHRIGQKKTVVAYRLIIKDTIEEKIRLLQKSKGALARDILGDEGFSKALTLDDFRFLLGGDEA